MGMGVCVSGITIYKCPVLVNFLLLPPFETTSSQGGEFILADDL